MASTEGRRTRFVKVAEVLGRYAAVGIAHVMWVMRPPWDLETIRHVDEVRALL